MIPQLGRRDFDPGGGMLDPDGARFLLFVPKNASSYLSELTRLHGWEFYNILLTRPQHLQEVIVVLRDPIQRWISGVAQYLVTYVLSPYGPNGPIFSDQTAWRDEFHSLTAEQFMDQYNTVVDRLIFDNPERLDDHVWPQNEIIGLVPDKYDLRFFHVDHVDDQLVSYLGMTAQPDLYRNDSRSSADMTQLQRFFRDILQQRPDYVQRLRDYYRDDYDMIAHIQ